MDSHLNRQAEEPSRAIWSTEYTEDDIIHSSSANKLTIIMTGKESLLLS